jgi:hypothetical protein
MRCISSMKVALERRHFEIFPALQFGAQDNLSGLTLPIFQTPVSASTTERRNKVVINVARV